MYLNRIRNLFRIWKFQTILNRRGIHESLLPRGFLGLLPSKLPPGLLYNLIQAFQPAELRLMLKAQYQQRLDRPILQSIVISVTIDHGRNPLKK